MSIFTFVQSDVLTSYALGQPKREVFRAGERAQGKETDLPLVSDSGREMDLADQFLVFQFGSQPNDQTILEASEVEPKLVGSPDQPDVLAVLQLLSFHVGSAAHIDKDTCATMRLNFGKDQSSSDTRFDTVFWSIAAGLRLYDEAKIGRSESRDLNGNFHRAFANRPIEIPGGLARLSFEVASHTEPPWWRRILGFGQTQAARRLVSLLGFPAITTQAIAVIDELLERLSDSQPTVLFRSLPMRLALSRWARDQFTGGNTKIRMGAMNPGLCVLARGRDYKSIADTDASYYPHYGKLVPAGVSDSALLSGQYHDPFRNMTYAIFRLGLKATTIDPTFNFSS
jgi:hypothetical protein